MLTVTLVAVSLQFTGVVATVAAPPALDPVPARTAVGTATQLSLRGGSLVPVTVVAPGIAVYQGTIIPTSGTSVFTNPPPATWPSNAGFVSQVQQTLQFIRTIPTGRRLLDSIAALRPLPAGPDSAAWGSASAIYHTASGAASDINVVIGISAAGEYGTDTGALSEPLDGRGAVSVMQVPQGLPAVTASDWAGGWLLMPPDAAMVHELCHVMQDLAGARDITRRPVLIRDRLHDTLATYQTARNELSAYGSQAALMAAFGYTLDPDTDAIEVAPDPAYQRSLMVASTYIRHRMTSGGSAADITTLRGVYTTRRAVAVSTPSEAEYVENRGLSLRPAYGESRLVVPASGDRPLYQLSEPYAQSLAEFSQSDQTNPAASPRLMPVHTMSTVFACALGVLYGNATHLNCTLDPMTDNPPATATQAAADYDAAVAAGRSIAQDNSQCLLPATSLGGVSDAPLYVNTTGLPADYVTAVQSAVTAWNSWGLPVTFTTTAPASGHTDISVHAVAPGFYVDSTLHIKYGVSSAYTASWSAACDPTTKISTLTLNTEELDPLSPAFRATVAAEVLGNLMGQDRTHGSNSGVVACQTVYWSPNVNRHNCPGGGMLPTAWDAANVWAFYQPGHVSGFPDSAMITNSSGQTLVPLNAKTGSSLQWQSNADIYTDDVHWMSVQWPGSTLSVLVNMDNGLCMTSPSLVLVSLRMNSCDASGALGWSLTSSAIGTTSTTGQLNGPRGDCLSTSNSNDVAITTGSGCDSGSTVTLTTAFPELSQSAPAPRHDETKRSLPDPGHPLVGQQSSRCLDVQYGGGSGTAVQLWDCNGSAAQRWNYHADTQTLTVYEPPGGSAPGDGVVPTSPALCLTATGTGDSSAIQVQNCTPNNGRQQWVMNTNGSVSNPTLGKCLNVSGGGTGNGAQLVLWSCNGGANEIFNTKDALDDPLIRLVPLASGSGRVLSLDDDILPIGARLTTPTTTNPSQYWNFQWIPNYSKGALYPGNSEDSGDCLTVFTWTLIPGYTTDTWGPGRDTPCTSPSTLMASAWAPTSNPDGSITFTVQAPAASGGGIVTKCLDLSGGTDTENNQVNVYDCNGTISQKWRVVPVTNSPDNPDSKTQDDEAADLALGATATQSSNYNPAWSADKAIDGNTGGSIGNGSVTHTNSDKNAWWQVDLGSDQVFNTVTIYGRTDCCTDRLSNFWVFTSDTPFNTTLTPQQQAMQPGVSHYYHPGPIPGTSQKLAAPIDGPARYVMIQLDGTNPLSLAEVKIADGTAPPGTTNNDLPVISLRSVSNNSYVSAESGGGNNLVANRSAIGTWEKFLLLHNDDGTVSLRALANNRYVTAENAGASPLIANRDSIGTWEKFQPVYNSDGSISLISKANNNTVARNTDNTLTANNATNSKFTVTVNN